MFNNISQPTAIVRGINIPAQRPKGGGSWTNKTFNTGIDEKGKAYIYNQATGQMVYYGEFGSQWDSITNGLKNQGFKEAWEGNRSNSGGGGGGNTGGGSTSGYGGGGTSGYGGGGTAKPALDTEKIKSLRSFIDNLDSIKGKSMEKATKTRDTRKKEKDTERSKERGKFDTGMVDIEQSLGDTLNNTNLNTANTVENLNSSLSTLGMGGGRALLRSILSSANQSNRKANTTYAKNKQNLTSSWNDYETGYNDDLNKIEDQYKYDAGEAEKAYLQNKQNALYQIGDVYNASGDTGTRGNIMGEADSLNQLIANSVFTNPSYTGTSRAMATPDVENMSANVGQYQANIGGVGQPVKGGNLGIRAISVNDKDLGIKKRQEGELGYGI